MQLINKETGQRKPASIPHVKTGGELHAMMDGDGQTKRVTFYVSADEREALHREADAADKFPGTIPRTTVRAGTRTRPSRARARGVEISREMSRSERGKDAPYDRHTT